MSIGLLRAALPAAVLFATYLAADLLANLVVSGAPLDDPLLPLALKISFRSTEYAVAAAVFAVLALVTAPLLAGRTPARARRLAAAGVGFLAATILTALCLAGWALFLFFRTFLTVDGLVLFAASPGQMLAHADALAPVFVHAAIAASLLAGVTHVLVLRHALRASADSLKNRLALFLLPSALLLIAALAAPAALRSPVDAALAGNRAVAHSREELTGPLATLFFSALRRLAPEADYALTPAEQELLIRHQQVAMEAVYPPPVQAAARRPNVLLVLVESLRPDTLAAYGATRSAMPSVDALAASGVVVEAAYAQASFSVYADMCPMSSQYPLRSPRMHNYPDRFLYPRVMIYDVLAALGYRTAVISSQDERWGNMISFLRTGSIDLFFHAPTILEDGNQADRQGAGTHSGKIDDRVTVDRAIEWIAAAPDTPFFAYLNLQGSHLPYQVPADFEAPFELPGGLAADTSLVAIARAMDDPDRDAQERAVLREAIRVKYRNAVAYVDRQLGRLFTALRERGMLDDTIVVVTGDTGQSLGEHGIFGHAATPYDAIMRVPLVMSGPGLPAGRLATVGEHIDLPPTILAAMGLPAHPSFQGVNLFERPLERPVFIISQTPVKDAYAVIAWPHKLIFDERSGQHLLFDLGEDPGEETDLSVAEPAVLRRLAGLLDLWKRAQLAYYSDQDRQLTEYPPQLDLEAIPVDTADVGSNEQSAR